MATVATQEQPASPTRRSRGELMRMFDKQNSVKHLCDHRENLSCEVSAVGTETSSFSSSDLSCRPPQEQPLEKVERTVRFAPPNIDSDEEDEDGYSVRCEVYVVERFTDPNLWWQPEETYDIRCECLGIVQDSQDDPECIAYPTLRFLELGWKEGVTGSQQLLNHMAAAPETRGLEFYIVPGSNERTRDHVQDVLMDQLNRVSANSLSAAARQASRPCLRLALVRARYDVEVANAPDDEEEEDYDDYDCDYGFRQGY